METFYRHFRHILLFRKLFVICTVLCLYVGKAGAIAPDWNVDPFQYNYQMTFVGVVYINSTQPIGTENMVGAFINNECRGFIKPSFNSTTGYWTYYLTAFGNTNGETVKIKFYNSSTDAIYDFTQTTLFRADANLGSVFEPIAWSWPLLNGADIKTFSLPGQIESDIIGTAINVVMPENNPAPLIATFTTSPGAIIKVGNIVQQSAKSANDFSKPVTYTVRSSDGSNTKIYTAKTVNYFMNVIATVYIDTLEANSPNDTLYSYLNGRLSFKAVSVLNNSIRARRFSFTLFNSTDTGTISFKFYSQLKSKTLDIGQKLAFKNNTTKGSQYNPIILSLPVLTGKTLFSFNIPGQIGPTYYNGNEVRVVVEKGVDALFVSPVFNVSAGAITTINDSVQYSGISKVIFNKTQIYKISASDLSSSGIYSVSAVNNLMNVIATVYIDSIEANSPNDTLFAYINGQLRGKAVSEFNSDIKARRFFLPIYSSTGTATINFKFYSQLKAKTFDISQTLPFTNLITKGNQKNPLKLSLPVLTGKSLFKFNIPGQIGETYYRGNEIRVIVPKGIDTSLVSPVFTISAGATATVNDSVQYSGINKLRFTNPQYYKITASDLSSSQTYIVKTVTYNERVIASVFIDSLEVGNLRDTLYAYTNGFLSGKTQPSFIDSIKRYRFDVKIFCYTDTATIRFRYYSQDKKQTYSFARTLAFNNGIVVSTVYEPFQLCNPELKKAQLITFTIPGQIGITLFDSDTLRIIVPLKAKLSSIVPTFNVSKGAILKIGNKVSYSGISKADFSKPISIKVLSSDTLISKYYYLKIVDYEMNFVATVFIGNTETENAKDTLYAYTNGILTGKATPDYYSDIKKYRFSLKLNSHTLNSSVRFKYYQSSSSKTTDLVNVIPFVNGKISGTVKIPVILSNPLLKGISLLNYTIPIQLGATIEEDKTIKIIVPKNSALSSVVPTFSASPGTHVMVNNLPQYSEISSINLENGAVYSIYSSEYSDTAIYKVVIIQNELAELKASALISPNNDGINDFWVIPDSEKLRESMVYIFNSLGTIIYQSTGYYAKWDGTYNGSPLPMGVYYYVIKSPGVIIASGSITLLK